MSLKRFSKISFKASLVASGCIYEKKSFYLFAASATVLRRSQWMGKKDDEDHKEEDMDKKEEQDEDCFTK